MVRAEVTGQCSRRLAQVWRYEGARTLATYLRRRDCVPALARNLGVPAEAVAATVLRHILEGLTVRVASSWLSDIRHCICGCLLPVTACRQFMTMFNSAARGSAGRVTLLHLQPCLLGHACGGSLGPLASGL